MRGDRMLTYKIDVLAELKKKGINTNKMRLEKLLSESAIQRLRKNASINCESIDKICKMLDCQPGEILEYIPDGQ